MPSVVFPRALRFLDRYQPVAADPDQARGLRPLHDPVEMCEVLARPCLEDPPADVRVDRVAGIEQFHEAAGVRQADAPGRGELAPRTSLWGARSLRAL